MLYPIATETRDLCSLDGIWKVHYDFKGVMEGTAAASAIPDDIDDVAVPASLNEQFTDRDKYLHMGTVWYYRHFRLPSTWAGRCVTLRFGAVNYRAEVYLDGALLGKHETGYTPFEFVLPEGLAPGSEHLLAVRVDNHLDIDTVPQGRVPPEAGGVAGWRVGNLPDVHYDFFPFTGIHRPVQLIASAPVRLTATRWATDTMTGDVAEGKAFFSVTGSADTIAVDIPALGYAASAEVDADGQASLAFRIAGVTAWSTQTPQLYDIQIRVLQEDDVVDHYVLPFGFRTIEISGAKILLNGTSVFLRGFGRHEDLAVIGKGLNLPFQVKDFNLMHWIGANSFRTSHYPYAEEQLRMADRQGILVISETAANTLSMCAVKKDPDARQRLFDLHCAHSRELVARDINHPSVIAWSLGNECEMWRDVSKGYFNELMRAIKPLDPSRPFTCVSMAAMCPEDIPDMEADEFDLIGYNAYPGWYFEQGRPERIRPWLTGHCQALWDTFGKPVLLSEFGADTIPGLHDEYGLMWTEEYQVEILRQMIGFAEECPHVVGAHVWNFADFKVGQHTGRIVLNWKGVFTRDRHPKAAAHFLRRIWTGRESLFPEKERDDTDDNASQARYV